MEKLVQVAESPEIEQYRGFAEELLEETDSVTLLSAALKMLIPKEPEPVLLNLTDDMQYKKKKHKNKHYKKSAKGDGRSKRPASRRSRKNPS
jgi:ATP-dependent RNA helicase DeaD